MVRDQGLKKVVEFGLACDGEYAQVRLCPELVEEMKRLKGSTDHDDIRTRKQLDRRFAVYCGEQIPLLNQESFKKLGEFPDGVGGTCGVFEFKSYQWRMYGIVLGLSGKRCFVGLRFDPKKKKNKADQELLKRVGKDAGVLSEYRSAKG